MPITPTDKIPSPFKFLHAYTRNEGHIFFGRKDEVESLYQAVNKYRLVLVYGQSGTGKTSLVQCGLANRFDTTDWLPFFIRKGEDINLSLRQEIGKSKALTAIPETDDQLLHSLNRISTRFLRPVYLIFDQFEELLILGSDEEKKQFIHTIDAILKSDETASCNLLFIMREEYFAYLDAFEEVIPTFSAMRLRVEPMRRARLEEVILKTCEGFHITLEQGQQTADQIIRSLTQKGGISLPYLQVYLDQLWQKDLDRSYPEGVPEGVALPPPLEFTEEEVKAAGTIEDVLAEFLATRSQVIQQELNAGFENADPKTVLQVLYAFTTLEGTRQPVPVRRQDKLIIPGERAPAYLRQLPAPVFTACLTALEKDRLLRSDENTYELAHDSLAAKIAERRQTEEGELLDLLTNLRSKYQYFAKEEDPLTPGQLEKWDEIGEAALIHFEETERQNLLGFVEWSRLKQEEEKERLRRQVEEQKRLRGEAEAKEKKARQRTRLAAGISVLAIALAIWAFSLRNQAQTLTLQSEDQKKEIQKNLDELANKEQDLQNSLKEAQEAKDTAGIRRIGAELASTEAKRQSHLADQERNKAETALDDLAKVSNKLILEFIQKADTAIYYLDYENALDNIEKASLFDYSKRFKSKITRLWMELIFWYHESHRYEQAEKLTRQALEYIQSEQPALAFSFQGKAHHLAHPEMAGFLAHIGPPSWLDTLQKRYYPYMMPVEGGVFTMGCDTLAGDSVKDCNEDEYPPHKVEVSSFKMASTETTLWQFGLYCAQAGLEIEKYANAKNLDWGLKGPLPVIEVSWWDAVGYSNWLNKQFGRDTVYAFFGDYNLAEREWPDSVAINPFTNKGQYRLPTEAEWEFAARGGIHAKKRHRFAGSDDLDSIGWYGGNSDSRVHQVGTKGPNELGLFDMSGNLWEWCQDWYGEIYYEDCEKSGTVTNPEGPEVSSYGSRVLRGGSWYNDVRDSRVSLRSSLNPWYGLSNLGFRLSQD